MGKRAVLRKDNRVLRRDLRTADLLLMRVQFQASRREVKIAREELQIELQKLNNLRTEVTTDRGQFILKDAYDADQLRMFDQIRTIRGSTGAGLDKAWGYLVGALGVIVVSIDVILRATGH